MSLKELIKNQTIIIDDHKRGCNEIKNWDDDSNDIHIDKSTNSRVKGERQKVKIRIPINSQRPIKIENAKGKIIPIPRMLEKEIKTAFENEDSRKDFIMEVMEVLRNFKTALTTEQRAHQILTNLSLHFNLNWTGEKITTYINEILTSYTEVYSDGNGLEYFLKLDDRRIEIGQNNGYAKQSRKVNRK